MLEASSAQYLKALASKALAINCLGTEVETDQPTPEERAQIIRERLQGHKHWTATFEPAIRMALAVLENLEWGVESSPQVAEELMVEAREKIRRAMAAWRVMNL